jgi:transcriptional regulator with XRE-family HTH domain
VTADHGSFGALLRDARLSAGLSQSDLSDRSGLPKPTLSRYENGHVLPSLITLRKLAEALGVTESTLLPGEKSPNEILIEALAAKGIEVRTSEEAQELAERIGEFLETAASVRRA